MSIGITDEHVELGASLRKWAAGARGIDAARAAEGEAGATFEDHWRAATEMGVASIALDESLGGGGGSALDAAVALEACAHALVPGALLSTTAAGLVLAGAGEAGAAGVRSVVDGEAVGIVLDGYVWDAPSATRFLAPAGDQWALVARDDLRCTPAVGLDLTRRFGRLDAEVAEGTGTVLPGVDTDAVCRAVTTFAAAEAAGVARWCLETAVEYAKTREQFGQKIGAFQAIKHLCAEMLETAEAVTAAAWDVAAAVDDEPEQWAFAADVASVTCFDGAVEVAKSCIQVLGGIGFTFEHEAHFYYRRAMSLRALIGDTSRAAERLAARAAHGVRRAVAVDLEGRDEAIRPDVRAEAERIAGLPESERRAALVDTGLLTPHWPAPYGRNADAVEQVVIDQELAQAGVTRPDLVIGAWALPTIIDHGNDEQRERFVRPTLLGELEWCQLFSEPGAGSDLASLRTKAVRVEGGWRLTGQKVWNSVAQRADWGICLARTNPDVPQHKGISYFLVDMKNSPGLDVRPLREMTGEELFNEVFLDDVFVPDECMVGEEGDGWRLARTTLANERVAMATIRLSTSTERAVELAGELELSGTQLAEVGRSVALSTVCTLLGLRTTLRSLAGQGPGAESSVAKLLGVRNRQEGSELVVTLQGPRVVDWDPTARREDAFGFDVWEMLNTRCLSIAGGTTQVLRNVVGERILGLPR